MRYLKRFESKVNYDDYFTDFTDDGWVINYEDGGLTISNYHYKDDSIGSLDFMVGNYGYYRLNTVMNPVFFSERKRKRKIFEDIVDSTQRLVSIEGYVSVSVFFNSGYIYDINLDRVYREVIRVLFNRKSTNWNHNI